MTNEDILEFIELVYEVTGKKFIQASPLLSNDEQQNLTKAIDSLDNLGDKLKFPMLAMALTVQFKMSPFKVVHCGKNGL